MKASIIWIFPSPWIIPLVNYSAKCKWCNEPSLSPQLACQDTLCLASPMLSGADVFTVELCVYSWMEKPLACDVSEKRSSLNTLFHTLKSPGYPRICIGRSARLELEWYPAWPISGQFLTPVRHCLWSWEFRTQYVIMCLKCIMRRGFRGPKETAGFLAGFSSVAFLTHVERLLFLIKATNAKVTSLWLYGSGRCPGALSPYFYRLVVGGHRHTHTRPTALNTCALRPAPPCQSL